MLKQNIVIAVLVLKQCYLHWGQYCLIPIKSLWCCYLFCFSIMLKQNLVIAILVLKQCYLHWGQYISIKSLWCCYLFCFSIMQHYAKAKHDYCSFGAETVLPALGSILFLISIKSLWCCYLFCFSIMLKQNIVIAVLVLKQCYLHHWGQYFWISIEPVVLLLVLF